MARGKGNVSTTTSSEISFVTDVFCASHNGPMPIGPPDTSYLTVVPKALATLTTDASEEQQNDPRWKPLVGTPSKPPVPGNILVPDPSPARDAADDGSPCTLVSSTPGSFIHRRRQGEYVPRPPVWKIYNLPTDASSVENGVEDIDTETCESNDDVFTDSQSYYVSDTRLPGIPIAEQIKKTAEISSERPEMVSEMEAMDLMVAHGTLYDT